MMAVAKVALPIEIAQARVSAVDFDGMPVGEPGLLHARDKRSDQINRQQPGQPGQWRRDAPRHFAWSTSDRIAGGAADAIPATVGL